MGLDFDAFRKDLTKRKAILEFISSKENPFRCCWNEVVPITMVPSMLSAYVASSPSELYLPESFYQLDHCGSDWIGHLSGTTYYGRWIEEPPKVCASYDAIVAAYKQSGVMGYPDETAMPTAAPKTPEILPPKIAKASCLSLNGNTRIIVAASGTRFGDPPKFDLSIDGEKLGSGSVDAAPDNTDKEVTQDAIYQAQTLFIYQAHLTKDSRQISIEFLNDRWAGENLTGDTNLWIRYVQVGDRVFTGHELKSTSADDLHGSSMGEWFVFPRTGTLKIDLPQELCN